MITGLFIFNQKGEVLISRAFRADFKRFAADVFRIQVISNPNIRSPVTHFTSGGGSSISFFHIKHNDVFLVATTKLNANAALIFETLYKFIAVSNSLIHELDEDAVRNNFVLVYEVLDEMLDFGYPQVTDIEMLKKFISTEVVKADPRSNAQKITVQATGATTWRSNDIKYRKNEVFVDVIESVNLLMSAKGTILRSDVNGKISMRVFLSGTPECKLGINDTAAADRSKVTGTKQTVALDDIQFHQCVRLGKFDADQSITFIPPDGEFDLMKYRSADNIQLPFKIQPIVNETSRTRVEYRISVVSQFPKTLTGQNVVVKIPTPLNTAKCDIQVPVGKARYVPKVNAIVWKISNFTGQNNYLLSAEAELSATTDKKQWSRPPISMEFEVVMFAASGLNVRFLRVVEKSNYKSIKWVRYTSKGGSYEVRVIHLNLFR